MQLLFLRGQIPQDRPVKQIVFDRLIDCDDVWTQIAAKLSDRLGGGEEWYWGGQRKWKFNDHFVERWVPSFQKIKPSFSPDVIFARGGFAEYDTILSTFPKAFKIYYGAGSRFYPQSRFKKYDLILSDTPEQQKIVQSKFPKIRCELWTKPAADNIFVPFYEKEKQYDIIVVANDTKTDIKGLSFLFPLVDEDFSILHVGISSSRLRKRYPHIKFTGWVPRKKIPYYYALSKVAAITVTTKDSCPRVVPEALACNCPVLALSRVRFWHDKYITPQTGKVCHRTEFLDTLQDMIKNYHEFSPYTYYKDCLSLDCCVDHLSSLISGI